MPLLADGRRLHLQQGPIDLIIEADGAPAAVDSAYRRAEAAFPEVLPSLVADLSLLRQPLGGALPPFRSPIARAMAAACWPYRQGFITPMAAVAGAVADHMLAALIEGGGLSRAYVNNGGDIALHLTPGAAFTAGVAADPRRGDLFGRLTIDAAQPARGLATSGWRGRSFSLGIADAVTILAASAAEADAAASIVANAVNADHPAIRRAPACSEQPDSDLGDRLVTLAVGALPPSVAASALDQGAAMAARLLEAGRIYGAVLILGADLRVIGAAGMLEAKREESAS
jgi:ApbE superfamily uncharacterized protein (UPF0280 family)